MDWEKIIKDGPSNEDLRQAGFFFDEDCRNDLQSYVYAYYEDDGADTPPFYVGEGKGDRCFAHLTRPDDHECARKIRELYRQHRWPTIRILRSGLKDNSMALEVEAAVIDTVGIQNLTNRQLGHHSRERGKQTVQEFRLAHSGRPVSPSSLPADSLVIRLSDKTYYEGIPETDLYDYTRSSWRIHNPRLNDRPRIRYVLSVHDGIIRQIYVPVGWFPAGSTLRHARKEGDLTTPDTVSTHPRWEFVGYVAVDEVSQLVGRRINWGNFRGCQNPCVYTNFLKTREQRDSVEADECLTKEQRLALEKEERASCQEPGAER